MFKLCDNGLYESVGITFSPLKWSDLIFHDPIFQSNNAYDLFNKQSRAASKSFRQSFHLINVKKAFSIQDFRDLLLTAQLG